MTKYIKGTIEWFDNLSQEGLITVDGIGTTYINNDPVHGFRLNKGKALALKARQTVLVKVHEDYNWRQVSAIKVPTVK